MNLINYLTKIKILKRIMPSLIRRFLIIFRKEIFIFKFNGLNLELNIKEPMDQMIFFHGYYENKQIEFLIKTIQDFKPDLFIDVGANSGFYSLFIGKEFPKLKIRSYEPIKKTFSKFKKNIKLNKNIESINKIKIYNFGLSDKKKVLKMKALIKNNYIQQGGFGVAQKYENSTSLLHTELAYFDKADSNIKIQNKIIAIKIDVEGHELNVLKGMKKIIINNKVILQIEIFNQYKKITNNFLLKNNFKRFNKIYSDGKIDYYYKNF
jgi:FkbM family methyltransferase